MDLIDTQASRVVAKALDGISKRHTAIAGNIANAETPGYKSLNVSFEESLKEVIEAENSRGRTSGFLPPGSLKTTNEKHINTRHIATSTAEYQPLIEQSEVIYRYDKNGVDIEKSMAELAKNTGRYSALSRLEGKAFQSIRSVIKSGG